MVIDDRRLVLHHRLHPDIRRLDLVDGDGGEMMKVGSLFSGIGGLDLGLERAGMDIVWQVENNPFCQKVLKKHWPEVPCYGDIKEIDFTTLPTVDLICGGFPCQPVSYAGKRQGSADERWLWPEYERCLREIKPRWCLVENVPGILSAESGRLFGRILRDLGTLGYDAVWDNIPAAAFGAPYLRYRIYLVAQFKHLRKLQPKRCFKDFWQRIVFSDWWERKPGMARVATGIPQQMDRINALGNAVVPQVAEWIGHRIMEAMNCNQ